MANENEAGSFNLEPGSNETLTGTWTWAGPDGESKVIVQSPTETTELTGGSVILNDRASGEKGRIQITNDDNNLILRATMSCILTTALNLIQSLCLRLVMF